MTNSKIIVGTSHLIHSPSQNFIKIKSLKDDYSRVLGFRPIKDDHEISKRIMRGGSWLTDFLSSIASHKFDPTWPQVLANKGFRPIKDIKPSNRQVIRGGGMRAAPLVAYIHESVTYRVSIFESTIGFRPIRSDNCQ